MMEGASAAASNTGLYGGQSPQGQVVPVNGSFGASQQSQQQQKDDPNVKSLYVGNLDPRVTDQILFEIFSSARPVVAVKIIPDKRQTHGGLNYGFVEFATHPDAEVALQAMNGRRVYEYEIRVNWAFTGGVQVHEDTSSHFHIFVGDLSSEVNDQILAKAFRGFPSMSDARVMWDMASGKSRGYGFVAFRERGDAENAINSMNGEWLGSRAIRVNWANQKMSRPKASSNAGFSSNGSANDGAAMSYEAVLGQTAQYNTTVYVGNLTNYTTQDQLQQMFQTFGYVIEIRMQPERGFAFVKLDSHENAALAITRLNGTVLNGRPAKCSWGKDKTADPKSVFGAAAAANPAYSYPYAYGIPPQQQYVPANAGGQQPNNNPQAWNNFGYEGYGYYGAANYPQPGQMMPPNAAAINTAHATTTAGTVPAGASAHTPQQPENSY